MVPTNSSSADANGSHPRVSESPESELSSVPLTKTVLHPEPLFGYWHNSAISQPCRKEVPAWHPPIPRKPQLQKLTSQTGLSTSETSPTADGAPPGCGGGRPAAEAPQPSAPGSGPLPGSRPGVSGNPTPSTAGLPLHPALAAPVQKEPSALGRWLPRNGGRTVVGLGIVGVGLGTP